MSLQPASQRASSPPRALRISFNRSGKDLSVVGATMVPKRAPAGDAGSAQKIEAGNGIWLELKHRDAVIYRRHVGQQLESRPEIFAGVRGAPIVRADPVESQTIEILVPVPPDLDLAELRLVVEEQQGRERRTLVDANLAELGRDKPPTTPPRSGRRGTPGSDGERGQ